MVKIFLIEVHVHVLAQKSEEATASLLAMLQTHYHDQNTQWFKMFDFYAKVVPSDTQSFDNCPRE